MTVKDDRRNGFITITLSSTQKEEILTRGGDKYRAWKGEVTTLASYAHNIKGSRLSKKSGRVCVCAAQGSRGEESRA